jgi:hypothetical protein
VALVRFTSPNFSNDIAEGAGSLSHTIQLSAPVSSPVDVTVQGPAYRIGDMNVAIQVIHFQPGQTTATFTTEVTQDTIYEGNEVFRFQITSATGAEIDRTPDADSIYGYIIDDDQPTLPTVRFASPNFTNDVVEGAGSLTHTLVLSSASSGPVDVTVQGPSYRIGDMNVATQIIHFQPGQTTATFTTQVFQDTIYEGNEVFRFQITSTTGAEIDRTPDVDSIYGYIIDDDQPTLPTVRFASPNFTNDVVEGAGSLTHTLVLSSASSGPVDVTVQGPSYRTGDMNVATQIIHFQPGQTTATFTTQVFQDTIYEGNEVFRFQITSATGAEIDRSPDVDSIYGYIIDDDQPLTDTVVSSDDYPASTASTGVVSIGGSITGHIETSQDTDWLAVTLTAGRTYQFDLAGSAAVQHVQLQVLNSGGTSLASDLEFNFARITFAPTLTGTYFLSAHSWDNSELGSYTLSAADITLGPINHAPTITSNGGVDTEYGACDDSRGDRCGRRHVKLCDQRRRRCEQVRDQRLNRCAVIHHGA